jgi:hypothetical protein
MREISNSHIILVEKTEGKRIFKEGDIDWNNIKIDIRDVEWHCRGLDLSGST